MLKVIFWNDCTLPDGPNATTSTFWRRSNPRNVSGARDVPDDLEPFLPSSARIVGRTDEKAPVKKRYTNPAHDLDPQHVSDVLARKREEEEKKAAEEKAKADEAAAIEALKSGTRVTDEAPEDDKTPPSGETEIEKAIREAEEARVAEEAAKAAANNTEAAGAPKKRKGK